MIHSRLAQKSHEIIKIFLLGLKIPLWLHFCCSYSELSQSEYTGSYFPSIPYWNQCLCSAWELKHTEKKVKPWDPIPDSSTISFSFLLFPIPVCILSLFLELFTHFFLLNRHQNKMKNFFHFLISGLRSQKLGLPSWKNKKCIFD